jgi:ATP-dependent DNA helicase RecG
MLEPLAYYCLLGSESSLAEGTSASKSRSEAELSNQPSDSGYNAEHATLGAEHATFQSTHRRRVDTESLRQSICQLCSQNPHTVKQLAEALGRSRNYLRNKHLIPMVREGLLRFLYPESAKHPHQAYVTNKNVGQDRH